MVALLCASARCDEAKWIDAGAELGVEFAPVGGLFHAGGSIWVCTPDMLQEVHGNGVRPHPGVPPDVASLVEDTQGVIWATHPFDGPLWRLMDGVWECWVGGVLHCIDGPCLSGPLPDDYVVPCYGAFEVPHPPVYHGIPYLPAGLPPFLLAAGADGGLWMARHDEYMPTPLWRVDGSATECWGRPPLPPLGKGVQSITARPGGGVDVAFGDIDASAVVSFDGTSWSSEDSPWPTCGLAYDVAGNLWASGHDLWVNVDGAWETVHQPSVFALGRLAPDPVAGVWCLADSVVHATTTAKTVYAAPPGEPQAIVLDDEGVPWVGTDVGLWRMVAPGTQVAPATWARVKRDSGHGR